MTAEVAIPINSFRSSSAHPWYALYRVRNRKFIRSLHDTITSSSMMSLGQAYLHQQDFTQEIILHREEGKEGREKENILVYMWRGVHYLSKRRCVYAYH